MPTQLNPANFDYMNEFLIYKLERTLDVLKEAKRNGAFVRKRDFKALRLYVKLARLYSRWGWYRAALVKIRFAQHRLERTEFNPVPNENYSAELDTRLSNAELTSAGRIVQYLE